MKHQTKLFEKQYVKVRNSIEKRGITMAKKAIAAQYNSFLEKSKTVDFRQWEQLVETAVSEEPIKLFLERYYPMSSTLAVMTRSNMLKGKADEENKVYNSIFQSKLTALARNSGTKISTITSTSKERILSVIRNVIDEADTGGWGVDKIASELYHQVGANLRGNGYSRARAIAQTEIISASNQASTFAADSTGYQYLKFWSTSGLPGIRESHIEAEQYSNERDGLRPDETFPNGLLYPGDPSGSAEEVINCYTGDLEIKSAIVSAQKLIYSGHMVKIVTGTGKTITVTPNHYILTENGMVKARDINKCHNLVCNSENIKSSLWNFRIGNHINNKPTIISEVFDSFVMKFASKMRPIIALDFDNDGARGNGDIHIVNANWKLNFNRGVKLFKNISNFSFKQTDSQRVLVERFCRLNFGFNGMFRTATGIIRFFNLIRSLFISHFTPFKFFGIGLTAKHYTMFTEMPIERNAWNATIIRNLIHANPRLIYLDKVTKVEVFKFNGHVYDFTSLTGTNIVNNIYTSNCRCTIMQEIVM